MKKILCIILASLALTLCACQSRPDIIKIYDDPAVMPSHMTLLYPEKAYDKTLAVLLRKYDSSVTSVAVCDEPGGELNVVYRLPEGIITYEIAAGGGLIAFYELTTYSDGSVKYSLKVIDTNNGNKVHSPYSKTVSEDNEIQTRFIGVFDGCVYYLTKSNLLGRCRVMKYSVKDKELTEYLGFEFTENEMTNNSSVTCISIKSGYLTCAVADGNRTTLKTYDLTTNELVREKALPYSAALVYMADHDYNTGLYAMYYVSAQGDERVGVFAYSDGDIKDIITLSEDEYVNHEQVSIYNNQISFEVQDTSKTEPHEQFYFAYYNVVSITDSDPVFTVPGVFCSVDTYDEFYGLEFDNKKGYDAVNLITIP